MKCAASRVSEQDGATSVEAEKHRHERLSHDDRREEILSAVRALSVEKGVGHFSISDVTKRVGCTRSLFYHYFPDKDAALDAALDEVVDGFIERLRLWNESRAEGDIEGALDTIVALVKQMVLFEEELPQSITTGRNLALYTGFVDRVTARTARYICDTTVRDFERLHEVRIDHVYETFYVLICGMIMFIRTHPDASDETVKDITAATLHIEGYTAKHADRRPAR